METKGSAGGSASSLHSKRSEPVGRKSSDWRLRWLFRVAGLLALLWFLVRVIPKPSRATYPCQRVAFPMASGFVVWLIGVVGSVAAFRKARFHFARSRRAIGAVLVAASIATALAAMSGGNEKAAWAEAPTANDPVGVARGINPGRVVWVHDPDATDWAGPDSGESCWESDHTDQAVVDRMLSLAVRGLAAERRDAQAWEAMFRHFNVEHGNGDRGYQAGEKIAIKVNLTTSNASYTADVGTREKTTWLDKAGDTTPQMILALLRQLVDAVGVEQSDISVGDPVSYFSQPWYDHMAPEFPDVHYLDHYAFAGRTPVQHSTTPFYWSTTDADEKLQDYLPVSFVEADYIVNFAVLKGHGAGITVCAKNLYGSLIRNPTGYEWGVQQDYYNLHFSLPAAGQSPGLGHYRALVDLMGHAQLGGKTLLYLIDGLYGGYYWEGTPYEWQMPPFNGDWPSSLFASQDPVAIDSVAYDFLLEEWPDVVNDGGGSPGSLQGGAEDYLHEAAQADGPPSGTFYDPERDGSALASLGVHEHWNNATDKQYTRNLGTGDGIELIYLAPAESPQEVPALSGRSVPVCFALLTGSALWIMRRTGRNLVRDRRRA